MIDLKEFTSDKNFQSLAHRMEGFSILFQELCKLTYGVIIETGTTRNLKNFLGDGCSTYWWNLAAQKNQNLKVFSVDINAENCALSSSAFRNVEVVHFDSVSWLEKFEEKEKIKLIYLDSFDWSPALNAESAFHHFSELASVWASLPSGCIIAVDDCHGVQFGKHWMIEFFLKHLGIDPIYRGYQIIWKKP